MNIVDCIVQFDQQEKDGNCWRSYFDGPIKGADISVVTNDPILGAIEGKKYRLIIEEI